MVQELPWDDYDGWPRVYNKKWAKWRKLVEAWYAGSVNDACPAARHWGGRNLDAILAGYVEVECANDAGGFLSKKEITVNAMQAKARGRKLRGVVPARAIKAEFVRSDD